MLFFMIEWLRGYNFLARGEKSMPIYKISIPIYKSNGTNIGVVITENFYISSKKCPTKEQTIQVLSNMNEEDFKSKSYYDGKWDDCIKALNGVKGFPKLKDNEWYAAIPYEHVNIWKGSISIRRLRVNNVNGERRKK